MFSNESCRDCVVTRKLSVQFDEEWKGAGHVVQTWQHVGQVGIGIEAGRDGGWGGTARGAARPVPFLYPFITSVN
jgi:hypothetical protein